MDPVFGWYNCCVLDARRTPLKLFEVDILAALAQEQECSGAISISGKMQQPLALSQSLGNGVLNSHYLPNNATDTVPNGATSTGLGPRSGAYGGSVNSHPATGMPAKKDTVISNTSANLLQTAGCGERGDGVNHRP